MDRSIVHRIYRWRGSADLVYLGPNGMAGWNETASPRTCHAILVGKGHDRRSIARARAGPSSEGLA